MCLEVSDYMFDMALMVVHTCSIYIGVCVIGAGAHIHNLPSNFNSNINSLKYYVLMERKGLLK